MFSKIVISSEEMVNRYKFSIFFREIIILVYKNPLFVDIFSLLLSKK
jgi:hypothetical protein